MSSDIIYESENLSNTTDEEIQYGSESSVSDSGNSFENKDEEHSIFSTASRTEMSFLVGEHSKFGRAIRYNSKFLENQSFYFYNSSVKWSDPEHFLKSQGKFSLSFSCTLFLP